MLLNRNSSSGTEERIAQHKHISKFKKNTYSTPHEPTIATEEFHEVSDEIPGPLFPALKQFISLVLDLFHNTPSSLLHHVHFLLELEGLFLVNETIMLSVLLVYI